MELGKRESAPTTGKRNKTLPTGLVLALALRFIAMSGCLNYFGFVSCEVTVWTARFQQGIQARWSFGKGLSLLFKCTLWQQHTRLCWANCPPGLQQPLVLFPASSLGFGVCPASPWESTQKAQTRIQANRYFRNKLILLNRHCSFSQIQIMEKPIHTDYRAISYFE